MKTINKAFIVIIVIFAVIAVYFRLGTGMKVHAAAARENGGVRCDITLSNGSLFDYEYLEFILISPEGAALEKAELSGQDINRLTQARTSVFISGAGDEKCRLEIGYYVLGDRRSVTVNVD